MCTPTGTCTLLAPGIASLPSLPSRNRLRMYPAFVNCTTIDWFSEWPKDALLEVAEKFLEEVCVCMGIGRLS